MPLGAPNQSQSPQGNPYTPPLPDPQIMEQFEGVNTSANRAGVPDAQCFWIDGLFPIAPRNLRTMPDAGNALYTASGGKTVICYGFYNIGAIAYMIVFLSDGSAVQVNMSGQQTTVLSAGTIASPSITNIGINQYGQQYLLIVADQVNGYWIWDGSLLYSSGSLAPGVVLTNVGSGYNTPPVVTATGGSGSGATFVATIANGQVENVAITNPGSGYRAGDTPSLVFTGGTSAGSGGTVTAILSHSAGGSGGTLTGIFVSRGGSIYQLTGVSIVSIGSSYSTEVGAYFNTAPGNSVWSPGGPGGGVAPPGLNLTESSGTISSVGIVANSANPDNLYNDLSGFPTITVADSGFYYVSGTSISSVGSGYSASTKVTASGGGSPQAQAILSPIIASGTLSSVVIESGGIYGSNTPPTLTVTDTSVSAAGTIELMPFAIQGTTIETYSGHVWIAQGPIVYASAPGSVSDFATSDGGLNFTSNSSFLKISYIKLLAINGFLYLIGDSSVDYISGVSTSGDPPTTTYTIQNADPQTGTPFPASVLTFGPNFLLGNSFGVHLSRGAALEKLSEMLDGVWNSVSPFSGTLQLSSAKATVFSKTIFVILVQIVDPIAGTTQNKLLIWNGKKAWWASLQGFGPLTFIAAQEINSILTAWGTDGTSIRPLFQTGSTGFQKAVQSRYWDAPGGYQFSKAVGRFWSIWNYHTNSNPTITLTLDSVGINAADGTTFNNSQTYTITGPTGTGYFVTPPQAVGQQGILNGMTLYTSEADVELVSAMIQSDPKISYRG